MHKHDIVVIGSSAGGIEAMQGLFRALPIDFPAAIFVVTHLNRQLPSFLAEILAKAGHLPTVTVLRTMKFKPGTVYVAPPDRHLILTATDVRINKGPRENWHRPSVDVLFRTAAAALGPRVVGVILSGFLDDGAAGLAAIKKNGGAAIVQAPGDAMYPDMPQHAIRAVKPDHIVPLSRLAETLTRVVKDAAPGRRNSKQSLEVAIESEIAKGTMNGREGLEKIGTPSTFTCPECQGPLWELRNGSLLRFRCQVGHAFSAETMLNAQQDIVERSLWVALGTLQSRAALWRRMLDRLKGPGSRPTLQYYRTREREARHDIKELRRILTRAGKLTNGVAEEPLKRRTGTKSS